jgi:hypothetical protein
MVPPTSLNIRKIISETLETGHPVNDMILALVEKNTSSSRSSDIVDYESLIIDLRYSISQVNLATLKLENAFNSR